jgi:two-component system response regulator LytT
VESLNTAILTKTSNRKLRIVLIHLLYWIFASSFFGVIWGSYDHDYVRSFSVQILSLPSRLFLAYGLIALLIPRYFDREKYLTFFLGFLVVIGVSCFGIQRAMIVFFIEGRFLPFKSEFYFSPSELLNTVLDVGIFSVIPVCYILWKGQRAISLRALEIEASDKGESQIPETEWINLKKGNEVIRLAYSDIKYLESMGNYVKFVTREAVHVIYGSISAFEKVLPSSKFGRIHRSYIVNEIHIRSVTSTKVRLDNEVLPIGRKYREATKARFEQI